MKLIFQQKVKNKKNKKFWIYLLLSKAKLHLEIHNFKFFYKLFKLKNKNSKY
jgi:hypothetical protein